MANQLAENIFSEYSEHMSAAERLKNDVLRELDRHLSGHQIALGAPLEGRVKSLASINEKVQRKPRPLTRLIELDDLIGIRVILLFHRHIVLVQDAIKEMFIVVSEENTATRLSENQFGYQSLHYVVRLREAWMGVPSLAAAGIFKIEIQVRTLAQHIWATTSHQLQYKKEDSVPPELRRAIHRASALLEVVDLEFERVLAARDAYIATQTIAPDENESLNVDIVRSVLDAMLPEENRGADEAYSDLLIDLLNFDIDTRAKLVDLIRRNASAVRREEARLVETVSAFRDEFDDLEDLRSGNVYLMHTGLVREALRAQFGDDVVSAWLVTARPESD
jgi:putative GTP pyrophosphokinase